MKKEIIFSLCLFFLFSNEVFAKECYNCGTNIEDDSHFCYSCGAITTGALTIKRKEPQSKQTTTINSTTSNNTSSKHVSKHQKSITSKQSSIKPATIPTIQVTNKSEIADNNTQEKDSSITQPVIPSKTIIDEYAYLADYSFINDIEKLLTETTSQSAIGQLNLLKGQNSAKLASLSNSYSLMTPYKKKIHDLHLQKLKFLEEYFKEWQNQDSGANKANCEGKKDLNLYCIAKINEAIDTMLSTESDSIAISQAVSIEKRMKVATEICIVTSPYLMLNQQRINRNEPLWVTQINNNSATVVHLGTSNGSLPLSGLITIEEMKKRTSWNPNVVYAYNRNSGDSAETGGRRERIRNIALFKNNYPYKHYRPGKGETYSLIAPKFWKD